MTLRKLPTLDIFCPLQGYKSAETVGGDGSVGAGWFGPTGLLQRSRNHQLSQRVHGMPILGRTISFYVQ